MSGTNKTNGTVDVAVVGAGPYGLSISAYLHGRQTSHRVFGTPMQSWRSMMPKGMLLKSDGFASSLYDPEDAFTIGAYCREVGLPYEDVGLPVPRETFVSYGLEFQKRKVPNLEPINVTGVRRTAAGFDVTTAAGETFTARKVVIATGITQFGYLPPVLEGLPREQVSHSSDHEDLGRFAGRKVAVIGAGSSAIDTAAILKDAGAEVHVVARANSILFHRPSKEPRPLFERLVNPRSGLGLGWRSRLCTDAPWLFHRMPADFRVRIVKRHLGPAPGWFVREKVEGKIPMHLGVSLDKAESKGDGVHLHLSGNGGPRELVVDHAIAGTGYRVALERLPFMTELVPSIRTLQGQPILTQSFESTVPGLYFVGLASANAFGPLTRFAFGARYTARRITRALAA